MIEVVDRAEPGVGERQARSGDREASRRAHPARGARRQEVRSVAGHRRGEARTAGAMESAGAIDFLEPRLAATEPVEERRAPDAERPHDAEARNDQRLAT